MLEALLPLVVIVVVLVVLVAAVKAFRTFGGKSLDEPPYERADLFSPAERSFLGVLDQALGSRFRVMGKVRLADVVKVKSGQAGGARQSAFNRIQSKHLDFVLCNPATLAVEFVLELDDKSHSQSRRRERDEFVDRALAGAGIRIVHIPAKRSYAIEDIRKAISGTPRE